MEDVQVNKKHFKPFNGEKYSVWKFRVRELLAGLNVIDVIDSVAPSPVTDEWKKAQRVARAAIVQHLSDSYLCFAKDGLTAKQILENLDKVYERKSLPSQHSVRKTLLTMKFKDDKPLVQHFAAFDDLLTEFLGAGGKLEEPDKVSHLMLTMPDTYDGVITAMETITEDTLTLEYVKIRLLDHEVKLKAKNSDTSAAVLHTERDKDNRKTHDNRGFKPRSFRTSLNKFKTNKFGFKGKCFYCGLKGHRQNECRHFKRSHRGDNPRERQRGENYRDRQRDRDGEERKKHRDHKTAQYTQSSEGSSGFSFMVGKYPNKTHEDGKIEFILDSGASDHIINRSDLIDEFADLSTPIKLSVAKNGTYISAIKKGMLRVISNTGIQGELKDVLYCPDIPHNLLSVTRLQEAGMTIVFDQQGVHISKNGKILIEGKTSKNLITVDFTVERNRASIVAQVSKKDNYELWHQRLGHIGRSKFIEMKSKGLISDLGQIEKITPDDSLCEACIYGKQARLPFNTQKNKEHIKRPLFIVHSDVAGPITPPTVNNKNYFVLFIDEYTHYCVTYLLTHKSEVFTVFKDYVAKAENHFDLKMVNLYSDNGREYLSNEMKEYCIEKGISYHLTVPYTPQLNGVAERMIKTITERARSMIAGAKLEKTFWGDAVLTATYLINMTPTKALKVDKTPYELWRDKKPQIKYLRVFGSTAYVHDKTRKGKFDEKSSKAILVGYEPNGYRVWDVDSEKYVVVRDVIVDETNFLQSRPIVKAENKIEEKRSGGTRNKTDVQDCGSKSVESRPSDDRKSDEDDAIETLATEGGPSKIAKIRNNERETTIGKNESTGESSSCNDGMNGSLRRSARIKELPSVSYREENITNDILCAQIVMEQIPKSYGEIKEREDRAQWERAVNDEINSLLVNKTWTLVRKPENKNIVDCKWIFTVKNDEFGKPVKCKARLVARGYSQEYMIDYEEVFAPVARIASFRLILAFANNNNLLIHHMDVKTAFLNGKLKEEIYMRVPEGIECEDNQVCKLNKALYGLKQAARCWFEAFEETLKERGFESSSVDRCIYILDHKDVLKNIYVVLYVDDLVIATASIETMNNFKDYLMKKFLMVDLKEIKLFLGIRVTRNQDQITLDQSGYIQTILEKFRMNDCNPVSAPLESKLDYVALNSEENCEAPCRNLIGCLMYVMVSTRPDLSAAINILSRFTNKNNKELWRCLKRVLRYLKGTKDLKLTYTKGVSKNILCGYVDSDWGSDETDRKSTTGYLFKMYDKCTISWGTRKQLSVAASSTEAEYMALYEAVKEALWLNSLANSIKLSIERPIVINEDNMGCISIGNNPTNHKRTKHIDIKYHITREQVEKGLITLNYVPTGQQIADALTKPLPAIKFMELRAQMGLE